MASLGLHRCYRHSHHPSFSKQRHIVAFNIQPIQDFKELSHYLAETVYCHLAVTKGVPVVRVSLLVQFFIDSFCDGHVTTLRLLTLNMWQSYDPLYSSVWLRHCSYSSHTHTHTYPHTQLPSFQQQAQKVASGWGTPMATSTQVSRGGAGYQHMLEHDKTLA